MDKMIPLDKQSKKKRKEYFKSKRNKWHINPVTRKSKSPHDYKKKKEEMRGSE